ncbi:WS/DGAT/MGAT family acyltransferase [Amycolatopsis bartoniae]|uniref:Diacylglycerol O-acyltransferase n=1 Tax=Amycolatopsis bartoniae TaxID=941986 RepID=A0A8H9MCV3_9PSEU|nr:wax ester/triacylglycerol synthase family O-acyltransferase [Amycolatopsis bartoniae]MBB2934474.1 WS/DGAT/MGAT family acyltransferase [Amycolatopsis bartoniae]TVT02207.1 wax ester/triacylglycerol synthase family O-acyltransferase [Amycolatopsis bartoniae]GHF47138.1 diacylglycerol O-acyltransferase [Amycolatopsis bartoniae]
MALMPFTDSMFLLVESREHPMHVGGLQLFRTPEGADRDYLRGLREDLLKADNVPPLFRRRPARPVNTAGYLAWAQDSDVDLDYHFRHSALPQPGRIRELLELTSRWHSTLLDRHRPLWEIHLVEGLRDGRFAMYSKIHHALLDGVSALRHLQGTLSDDPDDHDCPPPWGSRRPPREKARRGNRSLLDTARGSLEQLAGVAPAALRVAREAFREHTLTLPMQAPRTMLNVPIGGARRFAAQSWPLGRVRSIAAKTGTSRNDVVLAMCSGALRDYLIEQSALPDAPLVAMVPVSMRKQSDTESSGGNQIGAVLCNLATDKTDAAVRLATIHHSMREAKRIFNQLTPVQALLLSGINVAQLGVATVPGVVSNTRPPFNLVISNVPGPRKQMYWNGAHLDGIYPASVLLDGQALNITLTNNGDNLDFGITGCRRSVPHLQRLLLHLDTALSELEAAVA